jgi:hypothetical protein
MLTGNCMRVEPEWPWRSTCRVVKARESNGGHGSYSLANYYVICSFTGVCNVLCLVLSQLRAACFVIPLLFSLSLYLTFQ